MRLTDLPADVQAQLLQNTYALSAPDGTVYRLVVPAAATQEQILAKAQEAKQRIMAVTQDSSPSSVRPHQADQLALADSFALISLLAFAVLLFAMPFILRRQRSRKVLTRPTKLALLGVTVGLLTLEVGRVGPARAQRELASLQVSCEEAPPKAEDLTLECDPKRLGKAAHGPWEKYAKTSVGDEPLPDDRLPPGIQGELVRAQRRLEAWQSVNFVVVAVVVAALSVVPWLWYFLLNRVRELSQAIRG